MSCGFIYVVSHPRMGKGERKICGSTHHPFEVTARWERMSGDGRPLRLHSMSFVSDIGGTLRAINAELRKAKALTAKAGTGTIKCVLKEHLTEAMKKCLGENHAGIKASFDSHTGLFLSPSERLDGPPLQLVERIMRIIEPQKSSGNDRQIFAEPFTLGLVWSVLELQTNQLHIPEQYVPEIYRALAARLWGVRPSNSEMREVLATMRKAPAEYHLGRFAFARLMRSSLSRDVYGAEAMEQLRRFADHPGGFIDQTYIHYARLNYSKLSIQLLDTLTILGRSAVIAVMVLFLGILAMGGGPDAVMRTLISGFALGLLLFAGNFFELPDAAKTLGYVGVREWRKGRKKLTRFAMRPPQDAAPSEAAAETSAAA